MITKVKWNNHEILGNLELKFTKNDGSPYSTIVLAGENGTGKTTILETLSTFLNLGSIEPFEFIEYKIENDLYTITPLSENNKRFGFHKRTCNTDGSTNDILSNRNNNMDSINNDIFDIRHYGCSYSKARSGFTTDKVKSVTTSQLDSNKYENDSNENFTSIKQLIVDIDTQDNSDWMEISKSNTPKSLDEFLQTAKLSRFKNSFNNFFENLSFSRIDNSSADEKRILFKKYGHEISVDSLSTGEKQIVFRGTHLLKNSNSINGGIALIDEPELSMHPIWQKKILSYYRNLFISEAKQMTQLIIATHSEYVLSSALEDSSNVLVIVLSQSPSGISQKRITSPSVLPTITAAEINYLAFNIASTDYHIELYGNLQHKLGDVNVVDTDTYIKSHNLYNASIYRKPSSFTNRNGHVTNYETLSTYIRNAIDHPDPINRPYTSSELQRSIELLIAICNSIP